jgi:large subunit ribosomal protein L29
MKNSEIRNLNTDDLLKQIAVEKETLERLKFAHAISPIENPMRIRQSRRLIATMNTILTEKKA